MAKTQKPTSWTKAHDDALATLIALQISKREATKHLEPLAHAETAELVRQALQSRTNARARPTLKTTIVPGGPARAVPIVPTQQPIAPVTPAQAQVQPRISLRSFTPKAKINLRAFTPQPRRALPTAGASLPTAPLAPSAPAATQAAIEPPQATPAAAPKLSQISTDAEYEKLAPGSDFLWLPDGQVYTKPTK